MAKANCLQGSRHAALVVLLGLATCLIAERARADDDLYQGMAVSVVTADRQCFRDLLPVSGVLVAKNDIDVRPDKDGLQIGEVLVEPGDTVVAGQVLARLVQPPGAPPQTIAIQSPAAGIAVGVSAPVGSYASPRSAMPMFTIAVDGELELRGQVLVSNLPHLKIGEPTTLQIMGFEQLSGQVTSIDMTVDATTQLGTVRISVPSDPRLRPGSFVRAEVDAGQQCEVTVPLSAVLYGQEGPVVQLVSDGHVETRRVIIGLSSAGLVQILQGVESGDVVISIAGGFLREGDRVRPVPQQQAPKT